MKISIPTNDRITIAERSGRAKEFAIIEINASSFNIIEYKKNEHEHNHSEGEHEHHGHGDLIELLNGVSAVVVKKVGSHLKADLDSANIKIIKTSQVNIEDGIKEFIENN